MLGPAHLLTSALEPSRDREHDVYHIDDPVDVKASPKTDTLINIKIGNLGNHEKLKTQRNTDTQDPFRA